MTNIMRKRFKKLEKKKDIFNVVKNDGHVFFGGIIKFEFENL